MGGSLATRTRPYQASTTSRGTLSDWCPRLPLINGHLPSSLLLLLWHFHFQLFDILIILLQLLCNLVISSETLQFLSVYILKRHVVVLTNYFRRTWARATRQVAASLQILVAWGGLRIYCSLVLETDIVGEGGSLTLVPNPSLFNLRTRLIRTYGIWLQ